MKKDETEQKAWIYNFMLGFVGRIQLRALKKASKDCKKSEEKTLRGILTYAKDTEWGKAHNFAEILAARNFDELIERWQKNVPVQDYENLRPFIERHKNGEENLLFPGKPIMYATTSGTTNAPKWIPITPMYYENVYSKMTKLWLYTFMMHRPKVFSGKIVSVVGKVIEGYAPDGTICGSVSGRTQQDCPEIIKTLYSAPSEIFHIEDYSARNYALMRTGVEQNIKLFVTANPSTLLELQRSLDENFDEIMNDIEKGTLSQKFKIDDNIRAALAPLYKPNPSRAAELRAIKEKNGRILPKDYWPDFQVLNTWRCGNTKIYTEKFKDWFPPQTLHQEFSYFASECRFGLVMNGDCDTVPFVHMHYFEFVDFDEIDNPNPKFHQLHELKVGKRYIIYTTTYAGLYRYNMNDMIEVTGMYGNIPTIQFIQKVNGIISLTGEKLHEQQFMEAVALAKAETGMKCRFYAGFADVQDSVYHFYFDFTDENATHEQAEQFAKVVDAKLKDINMEYKAKRDSFRIKDPVAHLLKPDALESYKEEAIKQGLVRDGQFKMNLLMQDEKRHKIFKALVK